MYTFAVIVYFFLNSNPTSGIEPTCSRFHYEEKTLEKMIRQEIVVEKMKNEMEQINHKVIETLKDLNTERNKIAVDLEKKSEDFEAMKDDMKAAVAELKARTNEHIEAYTAEILKIKESAVTPTNIFKANVVDDKSLADGKVIIFTKSSLNIGNAYNNQTGTFVAPVGGSYLFTAQICSSPNVWLHYGIFVGERQVSFSLQGDKVWHTCSTSNTIVMVEKGEQVSVKCIASGSGSALWESAGRVENSFLGILVHRSS